MTTDTALRPPLWILGAGGLLGSSLAQLSSNRFEVFDASPIDWSSSAAGEAIDQEARRFADLTGDRPGYVAWCAGVGVVGSQSEALERETRSFESLLSALPSTCSLFLASSAGGVFGSRAGGPICESSPASPMSEYGENKLRQEALAARWAAESGGRTVVGRIANLYGPGQSLDKPQGLISQACFATLTRRHVNIFVPLDTVRDYIYVDDAAAMIADLLIAGGGGSPGTTLMKIVASSQSISIGGLIGEIRRVLGRPPSVMAIPSGHRRYQGSVLSFRSQVLRSLDRRALTPLPVGIAATADGLRRQLMRSAAPFP